MVSQSYEFAGIITDIHSPSTYSGANGDYTKQEVWIKTEEKYPQTVRFIFAQKAIDKLNNVKIGDKVAVSFRLNGRIADTKNGPACFTELAGYNIAVLESGVRPNTADSQEFPQDQHNIDNMFNNRSTESTATPSTEDDSGDLPF